MQVVHPLDGAEWTPWPAIFAYYELNAVVNVASMSCSAALS